MAKKAVLVTSYLPKILLIGINASYNRTINIESYFQEFLNLVKTNGATFHKTHFMKLREISPVCFFTKGRLEEVKQLCEQEEIEEIIISEVLTPQQERNLADLLNVKIFDRTRLILEIFENSAHSAEGKTQVAVAMLQHKKSRLAGKGVSMSQQKGVIGVRGGFGETVKEKETRDLDTQILKLKKRLKKIQKNHEIQRKNRLASRYPHACLIGYTNAGKSTILNALTKSSVYAEDKLFATLEITTRALYVNGTKKGLISDSVGFIQNLPHKLIEAFKSTLDELRYADLLLHVVDASDQNWEAHIRIVHEILHELDVDKKMLYIFNKVDKIENVDSYKETIKEYQPQVLTNAQNKKGLDELKTFLNSWNVEEKKGSNNETHNNTLSNTYDNITSSGNEN
ncbi:GTPase HflX [bacterium]|nr:GTPase HflX [bacterium]